MAKRKAARATTRRAAGSRAGAGGSRGGAARKKTAPRAASGQTGRKRPVQRTAKSATKAGRTRTGATARKAATGTPKPPARKQTAKAKTTATKRASSPARRATPRAAAGSGRPSGSGKSAVPLRKSPALNRARRVVNEDEDIVQSTPPSSLDLDRTASSARSGRKSLRDRFDDHTETSPAITAGDVDADWESAYSVGDEAPGGDNPTPDQDIVDEIGKAVGIEYQDNEELKGADKVEKRDRKRWELDPASSEDWEDR